MAEDQMHAQRFAEALQRLEQDGDVDRFVSETFAEDAELLRPELTRQGSGHIDGRDFWRQYRDLFTSVRSEFNRVSQAGNLGVLEWCTSGTRTSGEDIAYAGASLLDFTQDGRVQRFCDLLRHRRVPGRSTNRPGNVSRGSTGSATDLSRPRLEGKSG